MTLQQIQKRSNLDANLISRQYKLNLMADFMRLKYENPRKKQSEIANQLGKSASTLQRYRNEISFHHTEFNQITRINELKRLKILIFITFHFTNLTLKDLK